MSKQSGSQTRLVQGVLVAILVVLLVGVNFVNVADRTLLQSDEIKTAFDDEDVYERLTEDLQAELEQNLTGEAVDEDEARQLAQASLTEEFMRAEVNRNIDDIYAALNGGQADFGIRFEMQSVRENLYEETDDPAVKQEVNETVPEAVIAEEGVASGQVRTAQVVTSGIPSLLGLFTLLILGILGAFVYQFDSYRAVATNTGVSFGVAGGLSMLLSMVVLVTLRLVNVSPGSDAGIDPTVIFDGVTHAFESAIYSLLSQSVVLVVIGTLLVGIGRSDDNQLLRWTTADTPGEDASTTEPVADSTTESTDSQTTGPTVEE